jgi:hypothetical protein
MRDIRQRPRSLVRAIRGPITLITLGILFALNNFTQYRFEQTWPVLLIVFGLLSLARRSFEPPAPPPPGGYPPGGYPPGGYQPGSYSQGPYKGGPAPPGTQPK